MQVLLLDELTTFLDEEDQRGVLEAVRACVGGPDQVHAALACALPAWPFKVSCMHACNLG